MLQKLYAVRDKLADTYIQPFVNHNDETAKRDFAKNINNPGTPIYSSPEDYSLHYIGEFNNTTGELISDQQLPLKIAEATQLKEAPALHQQQAS